jgi:hypothetical protein
VGDSTASLAASTRSEDTSLGNKREDISVNNAPVSSAANLPQHTDEPASEAEDPKVVTGGSATPNVNVAVFLAGSGPTLLPNGTSRLSSAQRQWISVIKNEPDKPGTTSTAAASGSTAGEAMKPGTVILGQVSPQSNNPSMMHNIQKMVWNQFFGTALTTSNAQPARDDEDQKLVTGAPYGSRYTGDLGNKVDGLSAGTIDHVDKVVDETTPDSSAVTSTIDEVDSSSATGTEHTGKVVDDTTTVSSALTTTVAYAGGPSDTEKDSIENMIDRGTIRVSLRASRKLPMTRDDTANTPAVEGRSFDGVTRRKTYFNTARTVKGASVERDSVRGDFYLQMRDAWGFFMDPPARINFHRWDFH